MPKVNSRNVYDDTTFFLITIKNGDFDIKEYPNVGRKEKGTRFINETKNVDKEKYLLIGPHMDDSYSIEPTIITDIQEQRQRVFQHLQKNYVTFNPETVDL